MNNILDADLLVTLPAPLFSDETTKALAEILADELQLVATAIGRNVIYPRIQELPEVILDILAKDLHVDWYDYGYTLQEKRRIIKNSVKVHRYLGTKFAVETALGGVFPGTEVKEWFEYGGEPYTFKVNVNVDNGAPADKVEKTLDLVRFYKNLRSQMGEIGYVTKKNTTTYVAAACGMCVYADVWPQ
ncbi:hypothetical protein FACS1894127_5710 [Clostridia bacterium]|nr:hypothetical protein FACS1894127_5710 [Clostridia bacterium]